MDASNTAWVDGHGWDNPHERVDALGAVAPLSVVLDTVREVPWFAAATTASLLDLPQTRVQRATEYSERLYAEDRYVSADAILGFMEALRALNGR